MANRIITATALATALLLLSPVTGGGHPNVDRDGGEGAGWLDAVRISTAHAADSYDWTKPRGSIYSRRRSPNLWGSKPRRNPLFQKPSRTYGIPAWRSNRGGINPYDKPRKNYGGWGYRH